MWTNDAVILEVHESFSHVGQNSGDYLFAGKSHKFPSAQKVKGWCRPYQMLLMDGHTREVIVVRPSPV
jgi:hypothetical protein